MLFAATGFKTANIVCLIPFTAHFLRLITSPVHGTACR
jgi:hypothetical protein